MIIIDIKVYLVIECCVCCVFDVVLRHLLQLGPLGDLAAAAAAAAAVVAVSCLLDHSGAHFMATSSANARSFAAQQQQKQRQ